MAVKAQFMIGVDAVTRSRMDALRLVLNESRAEVGRRLIAAALETMERGNEPGLLRLKRLADGAGKSLADYVDDVIDHVPNSGAMRNVAPTITALEEDAKRKRGRVLQS